MNKKSALWFRAWAFGFYAAMVLNLTHFQWYGFVAVVGLSALSTLMFENYLDKHFESVKWIPILPKRKNDE